MDLGDPASKVVKGLGAGFGTIHGECQVMVLKVQADAREVDDGLDASATKLLGVT